MVLCVWRGASVCFSQTEHICFRLSPSPRALSVSYRRLQQVQTSPTSMFSFVGGLRRASELSAAAPILVVYAVTALQAVCKEHSVPTYSIHNHSTSLQTLITHSHTAHSTRYQVQRPQPQRAANEPPPWLHGCGSTIYRGRLIGFTARMLDDKDRLRGTRTVNLERYFTLMLAGLGTPSSPE